jgi:hypothetical protein
MRSTIASWLGRRRFHRALRDLARWLPQPLGHFYSPVTDPAALAADAGRLWPAQAIAHGLDVRDDAQRRLLREVFPALLADFDYPRAADGDPQRFHIGNDQFPEADARALFALLRHWRPARMIEVGSGYSTLLAADVNRRFLDGAMRLTAIEPFPRPFLDGLAGLHALRVERVQDTPLAVFAALDAGDVLFVDSSHVLKTGSDLADLLLRVLPTLRPGVRVHFHDVFLPDEYPREWAIDENRGWNEQYAVQALLANGAAFDIVFATHYALTRLAEDARPAFGDLAGRGWRASSLWLEKRAVVRG